MKKLGITVVINNSLPVIKFPSQKISLYKVFDVEDHVVMGSADINHNADPKGECNSSPT